MKKKNKLNIFSIFSIAILILIIGYMILMKLAFSGWDNGVISKGNDIIKTNLGDEFIAHYETKNFPDHDTVVTIMSKDKSLAVFGIENDYVRPNIIIQLNSPDLRCYEVSTYIIYRIKKGNFNGIDENSIAGAETNGNNELIIVSKALVSKGEWKWIKICGKFLLKAGDKNMKSTIENYSKGQFSEQELNLNKYSGISKEDMQSFAKQALGIK